MPGPNTHANLFSASVSARWNQSRSGGKWRRVRTGPLPSPALAGSWGRKTSSKWVRYTPYICVKYHIHTNPRFDILDKAGGENSAKYALPRPSLSSPHVSSRKDRDVVFLPRLGKYIPSIAIQCLCFTCRLALARSALLPFGIARPIPLLRYNISLRLDWLDSVSLGRISTRDSGASLIVLYCCSYVGVRDHVVATLTSCCP